MIVLLFIYYLKNILSINDIQAIMKPLTENFFGKEKDSDDIKLFDIYDDIYDIVKNELGYISEDLTNKIEASEASFNNVCDKNQKDFLQYFSLMCMLSYDIYLKKQVLATMVDKLKTDENTRKEEAKKAESKKADSKKADSKKADKK